MHLHPRDVSYYFQHQAPEHRTEEGPSAPFDTKECLKEEDDGEQGEVDDISS